MAFRSPGTSLADNLIHWSIPTAVDDELEEEASIFNDVLEAGSLEDKGKGKAKESMYVSLCEGMVNTVLDQESFLFSKEELDFFVSYRSLSYNARYLLARLLVRKTGKWFRIKDLKYVSELGVEGIEGAIDELCRASRKTQLTVSTVTRTSVISITPGDMKDIQGSYDSEAHTSNSTNRSPSRISTADDLQHIIFAEDESQANTKDLLDCLNVDELKDIARTMKLPNTLVTRKALTTALLAAATSQSTIKPFVQPSRKSKSTTGKDAQPGKLKQTVLTFTQMQSPKRETEGKASVTTLRQMALHCLKRCIRVNGAINALFHRLHIIYFRSTEHPTTILTPALLKWCRKRYYAHYTYERTSTIFPSRNALLAYEDALRMEAIMESMLEGEIDEEDCEREIDKWANELWNDKRSAIDKAPILKTSGEDKENVICLHNEIKDNSPHTAVVGLHENDRGVTPTGQDPEPPKKETQAAVNARRVLRVFKHVYPRWQELVQKRDTVKGEETRVAGPTRFDEGWILTRIVYKGALAYSCLKCYRREAELLEELLAQRYWRQGKRGLWYDRLALVLMHHLARETPKRPPSVAATIILGVEDKDNDVIGDCEENASAGNGEKMTILKKAMDVIVDGLHDEDTHIVQRQALQHRLTRMEKRLKVPKNERHECAGKLKVADEILVMGVRVYNRPGSVALDKTSKVVNGAQVVHCDVPISVQVQGKQAIQAHNEAMKKKRKEQLKEKWQGKSVWIGRGHEDVSVEVLALQWYEALGFKGFHSEGSIVSTIFGLLFWDIIFLSVPGAFETPYQSAPLDIVSECFYFARRDVIEKRLDEICRGKASEILSRTDDEHREKQTMCVGVRWDLFEKRDLFEIVDCLDPEGLSMICRLFCEDYGGRMSGIPDLIVWRSKDSQVKFVEVKGPGDHLSENQKVWIDVMLRSGITVELCRVAERGSEDQLMKKRKRIKRVEPVIKRDPDYDGHRGNVMSCVDGDRTVIHILESEDEQDEVDDDTNKVANPIPPGRTHSERGSVIRPTKRQRNSDPGPSTSNTLVELRGSSPDVPLGLLRQ